MKEIIAPMVCVLVICHAAEARINYALLEKGALAEVKLRVVDQDGIQLRVRKFGVGCLRTSQKTLSLWKA